MIQITGKNLWEKRTKKGKAAKMSEHMQLNLGCMKEEQECKTEVDGQSEQLIFRFKDRSS